MGAAVRSARGRLAVTTRHHPDDADRLAEARRALAAAKAEDYISKLVAEAPPLTPEQRDRLLVLLSPGAAA